MNIESFLDFGPASLYLVSVCGLCWALIGAGQSCVRALKKNGSGESIADINPNLRNIFIWLTLIWVLFGARILRAEIQSTEGRWSALLTLGLVSASVLTIVVIAISIRRKLMAGLKYDLTTWNLFVLRVSIASLLVGIVLLTIFYLPGVDSLISNLLQSDSSVPFKLLQLLGIAFLIVTAVLGLISNGWIKRHLALDTSTINVRISPELSGQYLGSTQNSGVDLETEYFSHIRKLKREKNR